MEGERLCVSGSVELDRVLCSLVVETALVAQKSVVWLLFLVSTQCLIFVYICFVCDLVFFLCCCWIVTVFWFMGGSLDMGVFWYCCFGVFNSVWPLGKFEGKKKKMRGKISPFTHFGETYFISDITNWKSKIQCLISLFQFFFSLLRNRGWNSVLLIFLMGEIIHILLNLDRVMKLGSHAEAWGCWICCSVILLFLCDGFLSLFFPEFLFRSLENEGK